MKRNTIVRAGLIGLVAAVLLTSCYAPLRNQSANLSLNVKSISPPLPGNEAVLLLIDDSYQADLAELLYLVSKGHQNGSLSTSDADRLTTLAKGIVTNGMVKFGGFPFYQLSVNGASGQITVPGIPADRSYLAKVFVFVPSYSFDPKDIDQHFADLLAYENIIYSPGESYTTDFTTWTVPASQILNVKAGETASIDITLTNAIP